MLAARYDQVVKELLEGFLPEYLELFYPDIAARLDFARTEFLDKETFTDLGEGSQRTADLVARLYTRTGEPEILILHQEVQRRRGGDFPFRVFEYWSLLKRKYRLPVLSLVLYLSPGGSAGGIVEEEYAEDLWGRRQLTFSYQTVGLPNLNAADYETLPNPVAPALSAMMRSSEADRVERKLQIFGSDVLLAQNIARRTLLINFVNLALPFSEAEQTLFEQRVQQERGEVAEMLTVYEERGIGKGQQNLLLKLIEARFGAVPVTVQERVRRITDTDVLTELGVRLLTAQTLADMGLETAQ